MHIREEFPDHTLDDTTCEETLHDLVFGTVPLERYQEIPFISYVLI